MHAAESVPSLASSVVLTLFLMSLGGCARTNAPPMETPSPEKSPNLPERSQSSDRPEAPKPAPSSYPAPPEAPPRGMVRLSVPGFDDAFVSFPSRPRAPLLVAAHGAGNTPDALCTTFRELVGDRGVVLCPAGPKMDVHSEGRYFPDHMALERIVFAALAALVAAYPNSVDDRDVVYAGYSQGATMGALMIASHGDRCPRLLLIEGGVRDWSVARGAAFHGAGGRRVLFACGTRSCKDHAETAARWLEQVGVAARVVFEAAGHTYEGPVAKSVGANFDWLVQDDPRWAKSAE